MSSFSTLGKAVKDLFDDKKHYDLKNNVLIVRAKAESGLTYTSKTQIADQLVSEIKVNGPSAFFGSTFEATASTAGKLQVKTKNAGKLLSGLTIENTLEDEKGLKLTSDVNYTYDIATLSLKPELSFAAKEYQLTAAATVAYNKFTVGAQVKTDKAFKTVADYDLGLGFKQGGDALSFTTSEKLSVGNFTFLHNYNKQTQLALSGVYGFQDATKRSLTIGGKYTPDSLNTFQGKLTSGGELTTLYTNVLRDGIKVGITSRVNLAKSDKPVFGASLSLGDDE